MTTPNTAPRKRHSTGDETMSEWFMLHQRNVAWGVVAVAIIVGGFWYYERSQSLKAQRAETAYFQARQSAAAGNLPLAISDLQKVVTRYQGTTAGTQAALTLSQALYDQKKFKEGLDVLNAAESKAPADFKPSIHVLQAAGYEELNDLLAAAQQYKLAAEATRFPVDKAEYQSAAARDYMAAGKVEEAKAIWAELAKDETGPGAAEARVRLGELQAKPLTKI